MEVTGCGAPCVDCQTQTVPVSAHTSTLLSTAGAALPPSDQ